MSEIPRENIGEGVVPLTGDTIRGQTTFTPGLVLNVVPDAEVLLHGSRLSRKIAMLAPLATAPNPERKAFQLPFAIKNRDEGATNFLEKRKLVLKGR
jgi:hypothetical protein